jgi:signal transduction histidine kinase
MIFKEALHNSLKYANATSVSMKAYIKTTDTFEIRLIDNGIGFDLATVKKGQGLNNMELRAQRIGGWLYLQSEANKGTTILFSFRIPQ